MSKSKSHAAPVIPMPTTAKTKAIIWSYQAGRPFDDVVEALRFEAVWLARHVNDHFDNNMTQDANEMRRSVIALLSLVIDVESFEVCEVPQAHE